MRDGEPVFFDPAGRQIPAAPARPPVADDAVGWLRAAIRQTGVDISAESGPPGWDGWPVDYDACVAAIGGYD